MQTCPRCGSQAVDQAPYCPACGHAMQAAPGPQSPVAGQTGKKTMLGISPDAPAPAQHAAVGKKTVMGMGMPVGETPEHATRQGVGHKTVLGMPMDAPAPAPVDPDPTIPDEPKVAAKNRTMMGIAPPELAAAAQPVGNKTMMGGPSPVPPAQPQAQPHPAPWQPPVSEPTQPQPWQPPQQAQAQAQPHAQWQQPQAQQPQAHPSQKKTMLGVAMPGVAPVHEPKPAPVPSPAAQPSQHKTMLGVAMPGIAPTHEPRQPAAPSPAVPAQPPSQHKTMLGGAMPGIAPTHEPRQPAAPSPPVPAQPPSQHKTMLGVAMPGIAPTHEPRQPQPVSPPYPAAPHAPPPPAAISPEPQSRPKRPRVVVATVPLYRRPAFVLAVLGISVIVVVGLFVLLWPTKPPISSQAMVNDEGKDVLRLTCATCPDGTVMTIDAAKGTVAAGVADVALARPLTVGDNRFTVQIDRPGSGRDESVELSMPVAFRVRPDLAGLEVDPPSFHVEVEAAQDTSVLIDGTAVKPEANGKARYPVDVSKECTGANAEVATIDRKVPYTIQPKGGKPSSGTVAVKVGITPLTLQAPRPQMVVDSEHFLVAGRTARGALIEIEGAKFATGADGTFSRKMQIKRPGETQVRVRARLPEHAPRTITFTVKRVEDLEAEAKAFESRAATDVRALMENVEAHRGKEVAVRGEVVEARTQGFVRIVLLDTVGQCSKPPCLARLVYAGSEALEKGNAVRVFGRVSGAQSAGGKAVPEIDVDFLLKGR